MLKLYQHTMYCTYGQGCVRFRSLYLCWIGAITFIRLASSQPDSRILIPRITALRALQQSQVQSAVAKQPFPEFPRKEDPQAVLSIFKCLYELVRAGKMEMWPGDGVTARPTPIRNHIWAYTGILTALLNWNLFDLQRSNSRVLEFKGLYLVRAKLDHMLPLNTNTKSLYGESNAGTIIIFDPERSNTR